MGEIIDRSFKYFKGMGAKYSDHDIQLKLPCWTFPVPDETKFVAGAKVAFGHVQHEKNKWDYQGKQFHFLGFDEIAEFTETQYLFLMAQNRKGVPGIWCYIRSTANPGGVGHGWVKSRFIEPFRDQEGNFLDEIKFFKRVNDEDIECQEDDPFGVSRAFCFATIQDNPSLIINDPDYVKRLHQLPETDKKAFLYGDWDVFSGQYFREWRKLYHVREEPVEPAYLKFLSLDYGYACPSSVGWWQVDYSGRLHRYRELYKEGFTYEKLARMIIELTPKEEKMDYCVADPAIWGDKSRHREGIHGESGAETMMNEFGRFTTLIKGDNTRLTGWGRLRTHLQNQTISCSPKCKDSIRTIPNLVHDETKVEDLNSDGEDHAADEWRYAVMSRPEGTPRPEPEIKKFTEAYFEHLEAQYQDNE